MDEPLVLIIRLKGNPHALPRGRNFKGRRCPVAITGKAKVYADALQRAARAVVLGVGLEAVEEAFAGKALCVSILWRFGTPFPARWGTLHALKPDKDNLEKMVLDCCERAGALGGNDCRVALGATQKTWAQHGSVSIRVEVAPDDVIKNLPAVGRIVRLEAPPAWLGG